MKEQYQQLKDLVMPLMNWLNKHTNEVFEICIDADLGCFFDRHIFIYSDVNKEIGIIESAPCQLPSEELLDELKKLTIPISQWLQNNTNEKSSLTGDCEQLLFFDGIMTMSEDFSTWHSAVFECEK